MTARSLAALLTPFTVAAGLALIGAPLIAGLNPAVQTIGALTIIALLGVPHGAGDLWTAQRSGLVSGMRSTAAFLLGYIALAAAVVIVWLLAPVATLAAFLGISAWHFGGDWKGCESALIRVCAGVSVLCAPAFAHTEAVAAIYGVLSGPSAAIIAQAQAWLLPVSVLIGAAALYRIRHRPWARRTSVELVILLLMAFVLEPLVYFALYFCALHAPRHMHGLLARAQGAQRGLWRHILGLSALALAAGGLGIAVLSAYGVPLEAAALRTTFIGLAALTVPHMVLVDAVAAYHARKRRETREAAHAVLPS